VKEEVTKQKMTIKTLKHSVQNLLAVFSVLFLAAFGVSAAQPMEEGEADIEEAAVAVVTIVNVDKASRQLTLKDADGNEWTFTAGPEVRNFDQIVRGDRVIIGYFQGFALGLGPKGSGIKERIDTLKVDRAALGEKPGAQVTKTIEATGEVTAVDKKKRTVTLQGAKKTLVLGVADDVDLAGVEVGQTVEAVYIESYAVSVVPAPKVSGTVHVESTAVALGIGVTWGHGTLTMYDGTTHKFKVEGLSVLDLGISKVEATGEVFNLVEAKDLAGTFVAGAAGAAFVGGGSVVAMKNGNGVVMQLKSHQKGVRLTLAGAGLKVGLVE